MRTRKGARLEVPDETLANMVLERAHRHADAPAFRAGTGAEAAAWTWRDVGMAAREVAAGLVSMGLKKGDHVAILSDTRPEWSLADFGTLVAGGVTVTVYPTLTAEQVGFLLNDAGAKFVFVENAAQYGKVAQVAEEAATVQAWITFEPVAAAEGALGKRTLALEALREAGRALLDASPAVVDERVASVEPDDVSTIIYTSGTTGVPKGAVLTHRNWVAASRSLIRVFDLDAYEEKRTIAFLPLAHVLSRLTLIVFTDLGGDITFSSPRTFAQDLHRVQPNAVTCVPRIWERMHQQIHKAVAGEPASKQRIFARAEAVAMAYGRAISGGGTAPLGLRLQHALYERLVYAKLRERLGMSHVVGALSTAAAIRPDLLCFFQGIGVRVVELWGLTELSGPGTTNTLDRFRPGTVGWPIPGVEVALDDEDGEILIAGPNVFVGYHARPDENAESFVERDGRRWFRTGDLGTFDDDGALRIVDRKKEIEVLDTGKKIAPVTVEERLKGASPFVADACLVATERKFAGCLIQPDFDALVQWAKSENVPFDEARVVVRPDPTGQPMTYAVGDDLLEHPRVRELFEMEVARCNGELADFERIRVFHLVPHAFTVDRDELTPTLKKKRRVILAHYAKDADAMFEATTAG